MKTIKILIGTMMIALSAMAVSSTAYADEYLKGGGYCHHGQQKVCWRHCDHKGCLRHCEYRPCDWRGHHHYYYR